jgi:anti-anti-sigma factor
VSSQSQKTHLKWPLRLTHSQSDGIAVLEVAGRIGHAASATFSEALTHASRQAGNQLILDLGGVDYVSSSGLGVLGAAARSQSTDGGALVLCRVSEPVRIAIELAGLLDTLAIESSREKAARRAKSSTASRAPE